MTSTPTPQPERQWVCHKPGWMGECSPQSTHHNGFDWGCGWIYFPAPSTPGEGAGRPNTAQRLAPTPFETWSAGMFTGSVLAAQGRPVRSFSEDEIRSEFTSWLEEWVHESDLTGSEA